MNDELQNKIIDRIDTEQIAPLPRWRFIWLRRMFWLFAILSIIIGSFAVGAILFLLADYRLHGLLLIPHDLTEFLLLVPYIWLIVFVMFIIIARTSIKYTKRGYRYGFGQIIFISITLSLILGSLLYLVGIGEVTHKFFNRIPFYDSTIHDSDEILEIQQINLQNIRE